MRKYTFSALITPGLAARDAAPGYRYRTGIRCVVQPRDREYFPAVISLDEQPAAGPRVRAVVSVVLAGREAAAFFAPGQHFTIWADAIVGHAIRGHGLAGYGVICGQESLSPRSASRSRPSLPITGVLTHACPTMHALWQTDG